MKIAKKLIPVALGLAIITGCASDYGSGLYAGEPIGYDGYYDNYYGPIYDGYWGDNNSFYFRRSYNDRRFHRGGRGHFRRGEFPGGRFQHFRGTLRPGGRVHMPHFHGGRGGFHGHGHGRR